VLRAPPLADFFRTKILVDLTRSGGAAVFGLVRF
jgi:hypothetical protein